MTSLNDWQSYVAEVHQVISTKLPRARVRKDVRLPGRLSGTPRQIDVLAEIDSESGPLRIAIEAKHHARRIDVKHVEGFIGLLRDVGIERGMMLSVSGYTQAAYQRAFADDVDLDLDVFSLAELVDWQNHGGLPFAGGNAAIVDAPLGWVLAPRPPEGMLAVLHQRGISVEMAIDQRELMYINFWDRAEMPSLSLLLDKQNADLRKWSPEVQLKVEAYDLRSEFPTFIRRAYISGESSVEITGFIEFPRFILFAVLLSPLAVENRNRRKLEYVIQTVVPVEMHLADEACQE
jgi:hypothetical protein